MLLICGSHYGEFHKSFYALTVPKTRPMELPIPKTPPACRIWDDLLLLLDCDLFEILGLFVLQIVVTFGQDHSNIHLIFDWIAHSTYGPYVQLSIWCIPCANAKVLSEADGREVSSKLLAHRLSTFRNKMFHPVYNCKSVKKVCKQMWNATQLANLLPIFENKHYGAPSGLLLLIWTPTMPTGLVFLNKLKVMNRAASVDDNVTIVKRFNPRSCFRFECFGLKTTSWWTISQLCSV